MLEEIALLHTRMPQAFSEFDASAEGRAWFSWNTCLRSIRIGIAEPAGSQLEFDREVEIYRGAEAYRFCLEVVTGLHSPLVGETEVMGQFKEAAKLAEVAGVPAAIRKFFRAVLADAKTVRQTHLLNLGSQSYGSLTRKFLKKSRSIHVLGAGALVEELLPWLKEFTTVEIFCRSPDKRRGLTQRFPNVRLLPLEGLDHDETEGNALVVAAPMSSKEILRWIDDHGHTFQTVVDLRGEAASDPIRGFDGETIGLGRLFTSVRENQLRIANVVDRAKEEIQRLSLRQANTVELRPFGWEDLCG